MTTQQKSAAGDIKITSYELEVGNVYFLVAISELPLGSTTNRLPQRVLDDARDGALANVRGRIVEEFEVFLAAATGKKGAWPGRQIVAGVPPDLVVRARLFLVDETLMQLMLVEKTGASPEAFLRMVDSLKLLR